MVSSKILVEVHEFDRVVALRVEVELLAKSLFMLLDELLLNVPQLLQAVVLRLSLRLR